MYYSLREKIKNVTGKVLFILLLTPFYSISSVTGPNYSDSGNYSISWPIRNPVSCSKRLPNYKIEIKDSSNKVIKSIDIYSSGQNGYGIKNLAPIGLVTHAVYHRSNCPTGNPIYWSLIGEHKTIVYGDRAGELMQDGSGNLYFSIKGSNSKMGYFKLVNSFEWVSEKITAQQWSEQNLSKATGYSVSMGHYSGGNNSDFKITKTSTGAEVILEYKGPLNYQVPQKPDAPDDGSIGNIDNNNDGIRDDVELLINELHPRGSKKANYLKHLSHHFRNYLLASNEFDQQRYIKEVYKAQQCLADEQNSYARVLATHLDSEARYKRYLARNEMLENYRMVGDSASCSLAGTGVEPLSSCFQTGVTYPNQVISERGTTQRSIIDILPGENIDVYLRAYNQLGDKARFSYFLNDVKKGEIRLSEGKTHLWKVTNYHYERDGYIKVKADDSDGSTYFRWRVECHE